MTLKIKRLENNPDLANAFTLPKYETLGSAGMDLQAAISEPIILKPGEIKLVKTGIANILNIY